MYCCLINVLINFINQQSFWQIHHEKLRFFKIPETTIQYSGNKYRVEYQQSSP